MLSDELKKVRKQIPNDNKFNLNFLRFPAPNRITPNSNNQIPSIKLSIARSEDNDEMYYIPKVDEYYGELNFFDILTYYGKYSNGVLGYGMNDRPSTDNFNNLEDARKWFEGVIGKPLYKINNISRLINHCFSLRIHKKRFIKLFWSMLSLLDDTLVTHQSYYT